jgi:hypothetical protein
MSRKCEMLDVLLQQQDEKIRVLQSAPLPGAMLTRRVAAELGSGARNHRNGARPS